MAIETKARDLVITDARSVIELRRYLNEEERTIARPVQTLWKKQSELVTIATVELALRAGTVPAEWEEPWSKMIREFVRDEIVTGWVKSISVAGDYMAKKINRLQRKQFDFDSTITRVKAWMDNSGGKLIVDLTSAQMGSVRALLQHQIALEVTSPYVLAQRIRPIVGLTVRETNAVTKFMAALSAEGVPANVITNQVAAYTKFLHKNRAQRIARTELSNGYNFGQMDSVKQAAAEDWLPGVPEKEWMAGGANPCEKCLENEAAGPIALEATFPSGHEHPTAHPQCECAVGYRVRR
jgi:hypothetical protein